MRVGGAAQNHFWGELSQQEIEPKMGEWTDIPKWALFRKVMVLRIVPYVMYSGKFSREKTFVDQ